MSDDLRPDPDVLLRAVEKEREGKGKLKVFFGMAAGVGKTYSMLKEARQKQTEGIDVVMGYLESHQRKETEELATVFETVPRMKLDYRGKVLEEMDLDAVLKRKPALVLVDELAHTNVPGVRNEKRYQDVLEAHCERDRRFHDGERAAPGKLCRHGGGDDRHIRP